LASPNHYFELTFDALANVPYRVWIRARAKSDSKWNDSVWVQFSNATSYRIGSTSALLVNLERCDGCGVAGWGWANSAYWLRQTTTVIFAQAGAQKVRIQTREDGIEIDQIVLSASTYLTTAPGAAIRDTTIVPRSAEPTAPATPAYNGTPVAVPGTIQAAYFDNGPPGVAYFDTTPGNSGGVLRATDVDLQRSSDGGHNIAWTSAGEWVTYSITVPSSGTYKARVKVASVGGGALQRSAGAPSNTTRTVTVPNTGGWQSWTTVTVPIDLAAGTQTITVRFTTANVNLRSIAVRVP
jgi:hypothetical protein